MVLDILEFNFFFLCNSIVYYRDFYSVKMFLVIGLYYKVVRCIIRFKEFSNKYCFLLG